MLVEGQKWPGTFAQFELRLKYMDNITYQCLGYLTGKLRILTVLVTDTSIIGYPTHRPQNYREYSV